MFALLTRIISLYTFISFYSVFWDLYNAAPGRMNNDSSPEARAFQEYV